MISLDLPYPPSTNHLFHNAAKGRSRTPRYNAWINEALWMVKQQRPAKIVGVFTLLIVATRPDLRRRDASNLIKPVEDLLVKAGVIEDDHLAQRVASEWADLGPVPGGKLCAVVEPYTASADAMARAA